MNFKRIARILICLVLVCCLMVDISPIKAEALEPATITVAASIGILVAIIGLCGGVAKDTTTDFLNDFINDCKNFLTLNYNFITDDDKIKVWSTANPDVPYAVDWEFIEAVREWMWESETVSGIEIPDGYALYGDTLLPSMDSFGTYLSEYGNVCVVDVNYTDADYYLIFSSCTPFYETSNGVEYLVIDNEDGTAFAYRRYRFHPDLNTSWAYDSGSDSRGSAFKYPASNVTWFEPESQPIYDSSITVADGLVAGHIASKDKELSNGYAEWWDNSVTIGDKNSDDYVIGAPIGLAPTLDETLELSQSDVWKGVSTYEQSGGDITDPDNGNNDDRNIPFGQAAAGSIIGWLLGDLTKIIIDHWGYPGDLRDAIRFFVENNRNFGSELYAAINQLGEALSEMTSSLTETLTQNLTEVITELSTMTETLTQALTQTLTEALTKALEEVKAMWLPREEYVKNKIDTLKDKYKFADSIAKTGKDMDEFLSTLGSKPPVIYIDLSAAEGDYVWGENMVLIDFSFYSKYKGEMDMILSAFLYLWFVWRLILNLPGIISGASGLVGAFNDSAHAGSSGFPAVQNTSVQSSTLTNTSSSTKAERGSLFTPMPGGTTHYEQWRAKQK